MAKEEQADTLRLYFENQKLLSELQNHTEPDDVLLQRGQEGFVGWMDLQLNRIDAEFLGVLEHSSQEPIIDEAGMKRRLAQFKGENV